MSVSPILKVKPDERVVVFRMGRARPDRVKGPGFVFVIPIIDLVVHVDMRRQSVHLPDVTIPLANGEPWPATVTISYRVTDPYLNVISIVDFSGYIRVRAAQAMDEGQSHPPQRGGEDAVVALADAIRARLVVDQQRFGFELLEVDVD
jgi:regulator of protease activity HflC (stomatin/prohibitin superfamily)